MNNKNNHNTYQLKYYENHYKRNMQPGETPYILQHINYIIKCADLKLSHSILEIGAGLGRCSLPLLKRGYKLTCVDISHKMLEELKAKAKNSALRTIAIDITEASFDEKFDRIIGFFTLHHIHDIEGCLRGIAKVAKPGAVIAFCEPIAYNFLYYLQIAFTKNMTWEGEKGIINMRKGYMFAAMKKVGFCDLNCVSYGFFPPLIANTTWGGKIEHLMEKVRIFRWAHAFQIFVCRMPDR
ncbi:MAG: class I SAM-dependent methyltransferase [Candidatus Omnitrophica bacterium]|nr:class I SAM-dependent methyltransferase [Candidatus Omnitrophota bacterium]